MTRNVYLDMIETLLLTKFPMDQRLNIMALRSPDLSPLDFFLWGFMKNVMYQDRTKTLQELKEHNTNAVSQITTNMLENT